jgi:hypothetical protein
MEGIKKEIVSILETGRVYYLLDYIENVLDSLIDEISVPGLTSSGEYLLKIENILNTDPPFTKEQKEEVIKIILPVFMQHNLVIGSE